MLAIAPMVLALGACDSVAPQPKLRTGDWGGEHVGLVVEPTRVTFLFDCANGSIDKPLVVLSDGSFDVNGTYAPVASAQAADHAPRAARYIGRVVGRHLTFTRVLVDDSEPTESFDAEFGVAPRIGACERAD